MAKYDRQVATAKKLVRKYGSLETFRQIRDETDQEKPWEDGDPLNTDKPVYMVFINDSTSISDVFAAYFSGTTIADGSTVVYIADFGIQPTNKDVLIKDGVEYRIETIDTLKPARQTILHSLKVKG